MRVRFDKLDEFIRAYDVYYLPLKNMASFTIRSDII